MLTINENKILQEVRYQVSRSGGKGGQNVNKVSTKVELCFDVLHSEFLSNEQKNILLEKSASKINADGILKLVCQEERTQLLNKKKVTDKFINLLRRSFIKKKKRIATRIPEIIKEERLNEKRKISEKKLLRHKPD